jgi:hypothetical protein
MDHRATIFRTLCIAQGLLWANLPSTQHLADSETVAQLRRLLRSSDVAEALRAGPDCELVFYLRAGARTLADDQGDDREIITKLWPILDNQALIEALYAEQDAANKTQTYPVRNRILALILSNFRSRGT